MTTTRVFLVLIVALGLFFSAAFMMSGYPLVLRTSQVAEIELEYDSSTLNLKCCADRRSEQVPSIGVKILNQKSYEIVIFVRSKQLHHGSSADKGGIAPVY